jgi:hypothetical protein
MMVRLHLCNVKETQAKKVYPEDDLRGRLESASMATSGRPYRNRRIVQARCTRGTPFPGVYDWKDYE